MKRYTVSYALYLTFVITTLSACQTANQLPDSWNDTASVTSSTSEVEQPSVPIASSSDEIIDFPDKNFEAEVREIIDKPTGDITRGDVWGG